MILDNKVKKALISSVAISLVILVTAIIAKNHIPAPPKTTEKSSYPTADSSNSNLSRRDSIVAFAKSLLGTPYQYASSSPQGFDCSGFINYVYAKFKIKLTRSSYTIAEEGVEIDSSEATKGDLIIFRGTDVNDPVVGHIGIIITEKGAPIEFIHSSSGRKNNGVVITKLSDGNYHQRFIKIKRVLD